MGRKIRASCVGVVVALLLSGCLGMPEGVAPVEGFALERYLGTWHEVARLDHSFERGLVAVSAQYALRDDGAVRVLNRGYDPEAGEWQEAEGVARFVGESSTAHLKVSFFGPFYGSYVVFELGDEYDYAFVSGYNHNYLWFLARSPQVSEPLRQRFLDRAAALGFKADDVIWVEPSAEN